MPSNLVIIGLLGLLTLPSCLGTRYLQEGEKLLVKDPNILGIDKELNKEMESLILQKANKRALGVLPISHLAHIHQMGLKSYKPEQYQEKINEINNRFDLKINSTDREKKKTRLTKRKTKKTDKLQVKIDEGNWFMRIGEPLAVYDSSLHDRSSQQMEQYLQTVGHFNSKATFNSQLIAGSKVKITYNILLQPAYFIDSLEYDIKDERIRQWSCNH